MTEDNNVMISSMKKIYSKYLGVHNRQSKFLIKYYAIAITIILTIAFLYR